MLHRSQFQSAFYAAGFFSILVWALDAGQAILVPVAFAMIAAFILWQAVAGMGRLPVLGKTPQWLRHMVVLSLFIIGLIVTIVQIRENIERLLRELPAYQANFESVMASLAARIGLDDVPNWKNSVDFLAGEVELRDIAARALAMFSDIGGQVVLVVVYTTLLLVERARFVEKVFVSFQDRREAESTLSLLTDISARIGAYLSVKTVVNIMLAIASYVALRLLEIDLAPFWAITIGVLNYVPYIGSLLGVAFPAAMAVAQSGSLWFSAATGISLMAIQVLFAYAVEPRLVGRRVNLSPFVVLLSLAFWYALWGIAGAILAVPLTAMFANVLAAVPRTRAVAIMLSNDGRV